MDERGKKPAPVVAESEPHQSISNLHCMAASSPEELHDLRQAASHLAEHYVEQHRRLVVLVAQIDLALDLMEGCS